MSLLDASTKIIRPSRGLVGTVSLPADKSVAHRAALFAALAEGTSQLVGFSEAEDPQSTLSCIRQLGIEIKEIEAGFEVHGKGLRGLSAPNTPIDCGNSGTTMRLLAGILAGQEFESVLIGDASLSARPMGRILDPLRGMGAQIEATSGQAPLRIQASDTGLRGIDYELPVASAQVKSCVLLAGLFAEGVTTVIENAPSRDHTERMLGLSTVEMGSQRYISVESGFVIQPRLWSIPTDFSSAAFYLVAGSVVPNSTLHLPRVGLNPSRRALLDILIAMGANIHITNEREISGEPIADLKVCSAQLHGIQVGGDVIGNVIDELPVLCVAAALASGKTSIRDARELRHKETDRIHAMVQGLSTLGAAIVEREDGFEIEGRETLSGGEVDSFGDHRIAMSLAVAALAAAEPVTIHGAEAASVSYPAFWDDLASIS